MSDTPGVMTLTAAKREELITQFRDTFKFASESDKAQRDRETEDLQFQVPELMWDAEAAASRKGTKDGGTVVLPRPMLSISKLDQPIRLSMNQVRKAHLGVNFHPVSEHATDDTAQTLQDLYRFSDRDSNGNVARFWAVDRVIKAGRGAYRLDVVPDEDGFQYGDLKIVIKRFLYQSCVLFDPSAQEPDYSDGDFAYVTSWMLLSKAARLYKSTRAAAASTSGLEWAGMVQEAPQWVTDSDAGKSIQIAECFWKDHEEQEVLILENGQAVLDGKVPNRRKVINRIVRDRVKVYRSVTDGFDILEEPRRWFGKYIPFIPVLGRELQPFNKERYTIGMIRNARDAQRFFNTAVSTLVERMFMEPRAPWIMVEGQDENRKNEWAKSNYLNIPVLHYKMVMDATGQAAAPPPFRTPMDQTGMSIALLATQEAGSLCQDATAFFDPSLGKNAPQHESGRKVLALQGQGDDANSDWLDSLAVAMNYEARVWLDLVAPEPGSDLAGVYDAPGRVATVIGGDDAKPRKIMLNRPYITDSETGIPRAARKGEPGAKHYDLKSGARYGVSIDIGQSFKSRLQEGDETLTRIVEADPTLLTVIGDLLFQFKDVPGAKDIAKRLNLLIRGQHPEMFKDEQSGQQDAQAKAQAMEQQLKTLTEQLQQASQALATDKAKQDANVAIAQLRETTQMEIARMNNAAKIEVARITAAKDAMNKDAELKEELLSTGLKVDAEAQANAIDRAHEMRLQHASQAHDVAMAAAGGMQRSGTTEKGQEHGQEQSKESSGSGSNEPTGGAGA